MSTGNYLIDIEDATITRILLAKRPDDATKTLVNKCDVFRGEKEEVFFAIIREVAPAVWLRQDRAFNVAKEFEQAMSLGQPMTTGTSQNRVMLVWSFFICAQSLRATKELSHGGPGVIGAYELLEALIGSPKAATGVPTTSAGKLVGWQPTTYAEPYILVGWELLGQTTTAAVYELQLRTRVQL